MFKKKRKIEGKPYDLSKSGLYDLKRKYLESLNK